MENARDKESGNRDGTISATATNSTGNTNANGDSVRTDDRNKSSIDVGNSNGQIRTVGDGDDVNRSAVGDQIVETATGYYYTPSGTIERIPDGHYISNGRLRKRRSNGRDTGNSDGNTRQDRSSTDQYEEKLDSESSIRVEKPLNIRGGKRGRKPKVKEESTKLTMVTMLATGASAIFTSLALLTKHDHWNLERPEAKHLAEALNEAISTLPEKYYAQVTGIIETWIPWINLCFVVGAIIIPRIEASSKRVEETHRKPNQTTDKRDESSTASTFDSSASIGWHH